MQQPDFGKTISPIGRAMSLAKRLGEHRHFVLIGAICISIVNLWVWGLGRNQVLDAAYAIPDGGGYCALSETGVQQTIKHYGSVILPASSSGGSYCCGFTFQVAMEVAERRGLLKDKSVADVRRFQKAWYGSAKGTELRQCALAVEELGIGREIDFADAARGDFVTYFRKIDIGHSVVFLNWIKNAEGECIGFRYRSSQPDTYGVSDYFEFFDDSGIGDASRAVDRERFFVARPDRRWWSRLFYPFGP